MGFGVLFISGMCECSYVLPLSQGPYGSVILKLIRFDVKLIWANFLSPRSPLERAR